MNEIYMNIAVKQSILAYNKNNVPVGAVIVKNNKVVAKAYNKKNSNNVSIYHAEILAILKACKKIGSWYLNDCELYVTLKPCRMCMNAIAESRISKVFYLMDSNYDENLNTNYERIIVNKCNDNFDYDKILKSFFEKIR